MHVSTKICKTYLFVINIDVKQFLKQLLKKHQNTMIIID